jgi:hypothetical protein
MSLRDWIRRLGAADEPREILPPRHSRREEARERHAAGGPAWTPADRHINPDAPGEVSDLAPGTPGFQSSRRTIGRR